MEDTRCRTQRASRCCWPEERSQKNGPPYVLIESDTGHKARSATTDHIQALQDAEEMLRDVMDAVDSNKDGRIEYHGV